MIRKLLNVVLFQVHKNVDQESDMLHNLSTLLTMLSGTAYKNVMSYVRLSLFLPPPLKKKCYITSRLEVKIHQSQRKTD